jgi:competence protein ComEC
VIKVPHHGSLTSSTPEFLRALHPAIAVFSAGRSNHFGHPAPEILQRYADVHAEIFRTDRNGQIDIDTDGHSFELHTHAK